MKNIMDTDGMSFEDYVKQKADTLEEFRNRYELEKKSGNDLFATMYKDSITEIEKDLKRMSHDGKCMLDYVNEELKSRTQGQEHDVVRVYTVDEDQVENELM